MPPYIVGKDPNWYVVQGSDTTMTPWNSEVCHPIKTEIILTSVYPLLKKVNLQL